MILCLYDPAALRIPIPSDPCECNRFPDPGTLSTTQVEAVLFPVFFKVTVMLPYQARHSSYHRKLQRACSHLQDKSWASTHTIHQIPTHKRIRPSRHIALTRILVSDKIIKTSKTTQGNCDIRFSRSDQDASSSPSAIYKYPYVFRRYDWTYWANCIMPPSDLIGPFKLIV